MADLQAIADTVKEWQSKDWYVKAAKEFLLNEVVPEDADLQAWIATLGQQLIIDEHGLQK